MSLSSVATVDTTSSTQSSSLTSDAPQLPTLREEYGQLSTNGVKLRQNDKHNNTIVQNRNGRFIRNHSVDSYDYQQVVDSPKESPIPPRKPARVNSEPPGSSNNRYRSQSTTNPPKPSRRRSSLRLAGNGMAKNRLQETLESDPNQDYNNQMIEINNIATLPPQGPQDRSSRLSATEQDQDYDDNDSYDEEYDSSTVCLMI